MNSKIDSCGINKNPRQMLVLDPQRWNGIMQHLLKNEIKTNISKEEVNYQNYLRDGSREMTKKWQNSVEAIRERKNEEKLKRDRERIIEGESRYKELMENDEKIRQEKIAYAQSIVNRLKSGPRELQSAAILSEVLKEQHEQRKIIANSRKLSNEEHLNEGRKIVAQAHQWIEAQAQKDKKYKQFIGDYKKEVLENIHQNQKTRENDAKQELEFIQKQREAADKEIKEQIERERAALDKKKETLRRNALEAMVIVEQRRRRALEESRAQDELIQCYSKGMEKISELKKKSENQRREQQVKLKEKVANMIYVDNSELLKKENERINKNATEMEEKMKEQDRKRLENKKKLKAERITQHLKDIEMEKQKKVEKLNETKKEMEIRFKNLEVDMAFEKQKKQRKFTELSKNRNILLQQMEERMECNRQAQLKDELDLKRIQNENENDDKNFFEFAQSKLEEAEKKSRPLLPIQRTIEQYKNLNRLTSPKGIPPHLVSNIPITRDCRHCEPIKYNMDELKSFDPLNQKPPQSSSSSSVKENKSRIWRNSQKKNNLI